jgi:hypothetical protein
LAEAKKTKAQMARDVLLAGISDIKTKEKATLLANAAIAGVKIMKVEFGVSAVSEDAACNLAFITMQLTSGTNVCDVRESSGRLRHLTATNYDISVLIDPAEINDSTLSEALTKLAAAGVSATTSEVDPIVELKLIPGIDVSRVVSFEVDATAAVAAAAQAAQAQQLQAMETVSLPPPMPLTKPEPPTRSNVFNDESGAAARPRTLLCLVAFATLLVCLSQER